MGSNEVKPVAQEPGIEGRESKETGVRECLAAEWKRCFCDPLSTCPGQHN